MMEQEKSYYKKFGRAKEEDCFTLQATTWDGKYPLLIIFPKKITKRIKQDVGDFLLHEIDDHDGYDHFQFLCNVYDTAQARKLNLNKKNG